LAPFEKTDNPLYATMRRSNICRAAEMDALIKNAVASDAMV
jgi:hypothetical protein